MKKQNGLTLIELMVTTVILVILLSAAVPSMESMFDKKSIKVIGPSFEKTMRFARAEAIKRGQTIRVSSLSGGRNWAAGWKVEIVTGTGPANVDLIHNIDAFPGDHIFTSGKTTLLEFSPSGSVSVIDRFSLNKANCKTGDKRYAYDVLLSGALNKSLTTCD